MSISVKPCVYGILNTTNSKWYVGQSINGRRRWYEHSSALRRKAHKNYHLQKAWDTYGEKAFAFIILETCEQGALIGLKHLSRGKDFNVFN